MINKNRKYDTPKTLLTQEFGKNVPTVIEISVNKENMDTPRTQGYAVTDVTAVSYEFRLDIKSMECHIQDFKQNMFLDGKYI